MMATLSFDPQCSGSLSLFVRASSFHGIIRVIPGKFRRYEYTPTIYLYSLRFLNQFVPALDIRIHGNLRRLGLTAVNCNQHAVQ
jgi:hypothetical protein